MSAKDNFTKSSGVMINVSATAEDIIEAIFDRDWYISQLLVPIEVDAFAHYLHNGAENRLSPHPLFDADWYLARYSEVEASGMNPLVHFVRVGAHEYPPRSPHPLFDTARYNSEVLGGVVAGVNPLLHYLATPGGWDFVPHPLFDARWYLNTYGAACAPLEHYIRNARTGFDPNHLFDSQWYIDRNMRGVSERVNPLVHYVQAADEGDYLQPGPLFDPEWYFSKRPDVKAAGNDPLVHYLRTGIGEGCSPNPLFDFEYYWANNQDVVASGKPLFEHYLHHGAGEGRNPHPYFDAKWYMGQHRSLDDAQANPLLHYLKNGHKKGFDPNPFFSGAWYCEAYLSGVEENPLVHFITRGEALKYKPHPLFEEDRYLQLNADIHNAVVNKHWHSGYKQFVMYGARELDYANSTRCFDFEWFGRRLDYDGAAYTADSADVNIAVSRGRFRHPIEHLFQRGMWEGRDGVRALYSGDRMVKVVRDLPGKADLRYGKNLVLFAHYDKDSLVDDYVVIYLKALYEQGADIVFISSTSDRVELAKIEKFVARFIMKNEAGRDFGSWYLALKVLGLDLGEKYDRVIFANDSFYFPVCPPAPLFEHMDRSGFNLYGLSDSHERMYHCQSFFLAFDQRAQAVLFPKFVEAFEFRPILTKGGQIREFEYGLTRMALDAGLSVGAYLSIDDARETVLKEPGFEKWRNMFRGGPGFINPSHDIWDLAIARFGWPGLKLELLRDNPKRIPHVERFAEIIGLGDVPAAVIEAHQARSRSVLPNVSRRPVQVRDNVQVALRERIQGNVSSESKRLVLFAHYDPQNIIDPHILAQLDAHRKLGNAVTFITPTDHPHELAKIRDKVSTILVKTEAGRDFGSWALALEAHKQELANYDSVIWINDSTYFPLFDPKPMFTAMEAKNLDFWGVVDSENTRWHVMSWFWAFGRKVIADGWFDWYLREYNPNHEKWAQIHNYEMRMPGLLKDNGYKVGAYITTEAVRKDVSENHKQHDAYGNRLYGFTMTHDFWDVIIEDFKCPALKVELVRDNPLGIDLSKLLDVIRQKTEFDPNLIANHIRRIKTSHLMAPEYRSQNEPEGADRDEGGRGRNQAGS